MENLNKTGALKPRHARAARALGLALTAADADAWATAGAVWTMTLTPAERGAVALVALGAAEIADAAEINRCFPAEAGPPITSFEGLMGEASMWSELASRNERKAYAAAAFMSLGQSDRRAFLDTLGREVAA